MITFGKIAIDQADDHTTGCLLHYNHFNNKYKMIVIELTKQQALDADLKTIQQISFTTNVDRPEGATMFSLLKKQKKPF